jgi:hypothetical protein
MSFSSWWAIRSKMERYTFFGNNTVWRQPLRPGLLPMGQANTALFEVMFGIRHDVVAKRGVSSLPLPIDKKVMDFLAIAI